MRWLLALALPMFAPSAASFHSRASYCSMDFISGFGFKGRTRFIATATADSLPASGSRLTRAPLDTAPRSISLPPFAQVFQVNEVSKVAPADFRASLRESKGKVAILSFSYGPDCSWGPSDGPAIWMTPGTKGLVEYGLLPPEKWVGGIPTFYGSYAYHEPYPVAPAYAREKGPIASAVEFMKFLDEIPPFQLPDTNKVNNFKATQPQRIAIRNWARRNPEVARLWPISRYTSDIDRRIAEAAFDTVRLPLAGTYLLTIHVSGAQALHMYVRTPLRPDHVLDHDRIGDRNIPTRHPRTFEAYLRSVADSETVLKRFRRLRVAGVLYFSIDSARFDRDSTVWRVGGDFLNTPAELAADSMSKARFLEIRKLVYTRLGEHELVLTTGTGTRYRNGEARLRFSLMAGPDTVGHVEGVRLSRETYSH